jgi:hypothetical protein
MRRVLRQAYVIAQLKIVLRKIQIEKGHKLDNLSSRENSEEDLQEARKTREMSKQLGPYAELEDKVLQNLSKLPR